MYYRRQEYSSHGKGAERQYVVHSLIEKAVARFST